MSDNSPVSVDPEDDLARGAFALLQAIAELGHASSQGERRAMLNRLALEPSVSVFLGRTGAIARPPGEPKSSSLREVTALGRAWLASPRLVQDAAGPPSTWTDRIHATLREFARVHRLPVDERGYILTSPASWRLNLWEPLRAAPGLPAEADLHQWVHHLRSSQAFAVNLFAPLQLGMPWARTIWNDVLPDVRGVTFEYPVEGDPLEERQDGGAHRTRIDARIDCGHDEAVLIEVKLTEREFGGCSASRDEENPHLATCTTPNLKLGDIDAACYLTQERKRPYFRRMLAPDSIVDPNAVEAISSDGCALRHGAYQLLRNLLMAQHVRDTEAKRVRFLVVSPNATLNPFLHARSGLYGEETVQRLLDRLVRPNFRRAVGVFDFRTVVERAATLGDQAAKWAEYMNEKYVGPLQVAVA